VKMIQLLMDLGADVDLENEEFPPAIAYHQDRVSSMDYIEK